MDQQELEMAIRPTGEELNGKSQTKSIDGHVSLTTNDGKKRSKLQMAAIVIALFVRPAFPPIEQMSHKHCLVLRPRLSPLQLLMEDKSFHCLWQPLTPLSSRQLHRPFLETSIPRRDILGLEARFFWLMLHLVRFGPRFLISGVGGPLS
jgi:hypothetical protein